MPGGDAVAGWIKDPAFDLTLIAGVTALACTMGCTAAAVPALFLPLLALHTWCFGFDHVVATFTKLAGRSEDRRRNRFLIFGLPPVVFVALCGLGYTAGVVALNTAYFAFQWFHTTRQSWGIAQHYRRAAGGLTWDPRWLSELTLWSVPVTGILHRCHQQPTKFLYMPLHLPSVPATVVVASAAISMALVVLFCWTRFVAWRGGALSLPHTLYFVSHLVVFALAYLVIEDLLAGWLLVNVWHNVQYLAYVWMHNRQRFGDRVHADARLLSWLSQPGWRRALGYFAACALISVPIFKGLFTVGDRLDVWLDGRMVSMTLLFALTLNFHHYIVDALIWRRARATL